MISEGILVEDTGGVLSVCFVSISPVTNTCFLGTAYLP